MRAKNAPLLQTDLLRARQEYRSARFACADDLVADLLKKASAETAALGARIAMRRGEPARAMQLLTRYAPVFRSRAEKAEAALLTGVAFSRLGDAPSSRSQFAKAKSLLREDDPLMQELRYQTAAALWIERRLDRAATALNKLGEPDDADLALHARILEGAIASASEHLARQGAILLRTVRDERTRRAPDAYLFGMLVTQIAALAVELPSTELRDAAREYERTVPWTNDIEDLHFHTVRALAWRHALDGDEFNAFRRLKEALNIATSPGWRVAALTDRAYLASALGEERWAAQELRDAHELASAIDWAATSGEEKLALPVLAELFAARDPAVALSYVATFHDLRERFARVLSSRDDRRVEALEAYSLGSVQAALGERSEARRLLERAWSIYDRLGIRWRAGRTARALATLGEGDVWAERAARDLHLYSRSWLSTSKHRGRSFATRVPSSATRPLTPAQLRVLELLLEGRQTDEVARELNRSAFTVRNHIKAILKAYGVRSRSALIVAASRGED